MTPAREPVAGVPTPAHQWARWWLYRDTQGQAGDQPGRLMDALLDAFDLADPYNLWRLLEAYPEADRAYHAHRRGHVATLRGLGDPAGQVLGIGRDDWRTPPGL